MSIKRAAPSDQPKRLPQSPSLFFFDTSPVPMWIYDVETLRVLAVNDCALQYFGRRRDEVVGMPSTGLAAGPESPADSAGDGNGKLRHHRRPDGTSAVMKLETSRLEVDGRPACLVAALDVTQETAALGDAERRCRELAASEKRLLERERRFTELFETASDWYWEADAQGRLTFISQNFLARYGIKLEDRIGKRLNDVAEVKFDPESAAKVMAAIRDRQSYSDLIYSLTLPNGNIIWVSASAVPMLDSAGQFAGYCGICKDITAKIEADRALRDSERQFKQLLEASSDYYWEQDAQFRHSHISPSYAKLLGVPVEEVVGKRLMDIPGMSVETQMGIMALKAHKARQPYRDFVYSRRMPDGTRRWFKSSGAPFFDRNGVFQGFRGAGADITQHVEAEAAARLTQQRLHEAVAHVTQPIVVFDAEDRVISYNQAFVDLHQAPGTNSCVGPGASFVEIAQWQRRTGFYAAGPEDSPVDVETLLARYQTEAEHSYHLRDGRWMQVTYRRLPGQGRVGLWTDVTALKRAEAERYTLEQQLHHAQRLDALGTLAGGVAHEINNALVPVIALTKMVAGRLPEDSRDRRNLATVLAGAERSRKLVKQILAFSRKEEDTGTPLGSVDVGAVLRDALRFLHATLPATIRLEEEISSVPPVMGDAQQLHQVIVNLVTNAAQAIGEAQGRITVGVGLEADGKALRLSVADTGCGMDEATKARIFEPFFTTKKVGDGTGLGLSVVHGIIDKHRGHIEVVSAPGEGTCFKIMLPVAQAGGLA